ncbi:FkbM family methyltransferase [Rhizobium sullae]|uniref:FkbM family methyltransferase n=1 Tax=Rhizobium sullae TaxID=50338 RepID=A0A2N0D0U9_RHISU|nr:FkbM family methyltransferase [Rhizobium sullae]PKA39746.1 FkbM family methyltransferase [Rhizobium sullae]UWU16174.1 FkbM family methyltransferase [Rhizobium sullae]
MSQLEFFISKAVRFPPKLVKQTFRRIKRFYKTRIVRDEFTVEIRRWFKDNGDATLRLEYDLSEESVVFDLGGYVGDFAEAMSQRYNCYVYVFEPSREFHDKCLERFRDNPKVRCFNFGLGDADGHFVLSQDLDGSSTKRHEQPEGGELVEIKNFSTVFASLGLESIDLMKINIEGGEYDILPHLIQTGLVEKINHIQVQFHNFVQNARKLRENIISGLKRTHERDWCYTFVWESWSRRR